MILHNKQKEVAQSRTRFKVIRAGRRSGKTAFNIEECSYKAVSKDDRNILYVSPTQRQSRSIVWEDFKRRLSPINAEFNESRLEVKVPTAEGGHSTIYIGGWENRENYRGQRFHHIVFDELDTLRDFFIGWHEIFRPTLTDTKGTTNFIGTPKAENPNLRRLEKVAETDDDYACFYFTSYDNPHVEDSEIDKAKREIDGKTFKQEYLAEYIENAGALFKHTALVDMFTNTITKSNERYLTIDIADDGEDTTVFAFWQGMECYRIDQFERLNTEGIINQIREYAAQDRIPYSQIIVDAIGVGAGVASSSLLDGLVAYKGSLGAIKTDSDPVRLPNVHYMKDAPLISEYRNLRSQCIFELARAVNSHDIAVRTDDVRVREAIIEELATYQDVSPGDGKRMATKKEDVKAVLGRSPDLSDVLQMRMYFAVREKLLPYQSEQAAMIYDEMQNQFTQAEDNQGLNATR